MKHEQGARKQGFVLIDWVLLLFLLAGIAFGVFVWYRRQQTELPTSTVEYLLCIENIDSSLYGFPEDALFPISAGMSVMNDNATFPMGRVVGVLVRPHRVPAVRDGEVMLTELTGYYDLYITVAAEAVISPNDGIRVSDIRIAAGGRGDFRIGGFYAHDAAIIWVDRRGTE